ncbi:MAG: protein-disulfide reductase DsbD family protein [Bacteroidota bacterium]|nr:protein-disulfide reductase DsbD family protein [Bacteroidota bacterium]
MKKLIFSLGVLLTGVVISAKAQSPVSWSFSAIKLDAKTYEVRLVATLEGDWHIYSQSTPDGGPVPTSINFSKNPLVEFDGKTTEVGKMEEHFEPLFGVKVKQYSSKVMFVQKIKLKAAVKTAVNGAVEFMVCNDEQCMPPAKQTFSVSLN